MRYQLEVFDANNKLIGSMVIIIGIDANNKPTFLWQWQGKGGSSFGQWEWRLGGSDWRIVFTKFFDQGSLWGTLYGDWKSLPTPQSYPQQPWFSKVGVKEGDVSINTASSYFNATWKLK